MCTSPSLLLASFTHRWRSEALAAFLTRCCGAVLMAGGVCPERGTAAGDGVMGVRERPWWALAGTLTGLLLTPLLARPAAGLLCWVGRTGPPMGVRVRPREDVEEEVEEDEEDELAADEGGDEEEEEAEEEGECDEKVEEGKSEPWPERDAGREELLYLPPSAGLMEPSLSEESSAGLMAGGHAELLLSLVRPAGVFAASEGD